MATGAGAFEVGGFVFKADQIRAAACEADMNPPLSLLESLISWDIPNGRFLSTCVFNNIVGYPQGRFVSSCVFSQIVGYSALFGASASPAAGLLARAFSFISRSVT